MPTSPLPDTNGRFPATTALALLSCLAGIAVLIFPTREDVHRLIETTTAPLAKQIHEHTALPTHPAQQRWSDTLENRLLTLDQRLEQLEIHLAELQAMVRARCQTAMIGGRL